MIEFWHLDPLNRDKINWKVECQALKEEQIRVYAVQALNRSEADAFYRYTVVAYTV